MKMQRAFSRITILALAVVLMATACSKATPAASGGSSSAPATTPSGTGGGTFPIGSDNANDHGTKSVTGASTVNIEQHNTSDQGYFFEPTILSGSAGQTLTVHVENKGTVPHTFTIDAQNISVELQPGDQKDIQVTLPTSGAVEFYCMFHHGLGMAGELLVA
jgi:plastocyanin